MLIDNSSPNRSGALDFRRRPEDAPHDSGLLRPMHLDHLLDAAERIEEGESVPQHLLELLGEAPTLGGMRPKAVLVDQGRQWLAKFPTRRDPFDIPLIEHATLELARLAKMDVPDTRLIDVPGRGTVMMIARFDRGTEAEGYRKWHMVSALTALGVHEMDSPKMAYADIADALGRLGAAGQVTADRHELFRRMVFNILVCNDDDHLRNHALVHRGDFGGWRLSPLYDVVPRPSGGSERFLHLGIGAQGRLSTLDNALTHCARFALTPRPAGWERCNAFRRPGLDGSCNAVCRSPRAGATGRAGRASPLACTSLESCVGQHRSTCRDRRMRQRGDGADDAATRVK
ncbi:HipA domain-containing protein [Pantoea ananatis]|uniref:type II toxin-antitoxin system HipA family toxin n=1 Tax=Pantoea ananas TaxID=553 RepID=UPI002220849A|nr:HipA domain-containing protein [Pantoea ananatis]